jgi:hypothetical protein
MVARNWTAGYELIPAGTEAVSLGDDRIRNLKVDIRERLETEHSFGDDESAGEEGNHMQGSAVTFFQPAAPTNLSVPAEGLPAVPAGAGKALATEDDGRLWTMDETGAYQLYSYHQGNASTAPYGRWRPVNNIDPTTMTDYQEQGAFQHTGVANNTVEIVQDAAGDMTATCTIPAVGLWYLQIVARHVGSLTGGSDQNVYTGIRVIDDVDASSGPTTTTDYWTGQERRGTGGATRRFTQETSRNVVVGSPALTLGEDVEVKLLYIVDTARLSFELGSNSATGGIVNVGCAIDIKILPYGLAV